MRPFGILILLASAVGTAVTSGCAFKPMDSPIFGATGGGNGEGTGGTRGRLDSGIMLPDAGRDLIVTTDGDPTNGPSADANCGNQPFTVATLPPDLLIVLDRSGSMNENSMGMTCGNAGCGADSKWAQVTAAINAVVGRTEGTINWGLKFFGTGMGANGNAGCAVAAGAAVPPGANNARAIADAIALPANQPGTSTPTRAAMLSAGEYLATLTDLNRRFVLLATDGQPNCAAGGGGNGNDDVAAIASVSTVMTMGYPTFVIGIATTGMADTTLNSMAMNGGYARTGTPQYYSVTSQAELEAALATIQAVIGGMCTYPLGVPGDEADITKTIVTVDGAPSPKDDPNGWHFDDPTMRSITFTGTTCDALLAGSAKNVQVLFGCKVVVL